MEPADVSAYLDATRSKGQFHRVVTMVTMRVLTKCQKKNRNQQECVAHANRLIDQVMEGLTVPENFSTDIKKMKKVSKKVVKELQEKFCSRNELESRIQLQDPAVDEAIVQSVRAHISEFSEENYTYDFHGEQKGSLRKRKHCEETSAGSVAEDTTDRNSKEKKNNFDFTQQPSMESADVSASLEATQSEDQLHLVVTMLTVSVLIECQNKNRSQQEWVPHANRLIDQVMEGLTVPENFSPHEKKTERVSKKVVKELQEKFCSRNGLELRIQLQDPVVDEAIVQSVRAHISEFSEESSLCYNCFVYILGFVAGFVIIYLLKVKYW